MERDRARSLEEQWAHLASDAAQDEFGIMVVDDVKAPEEPDLSDWGDPSQIGQVTFQATPAEVARAERYCNLAIFFYSHWRWPFFRRLGDWCARRAFFFTDGNIPIGDPGRKRDMRYLTRSRQI